VAADAVKFVGCGRCPRPDLYGTDAQCEPAKGTKAVIALPPGTYRISASRPGAGKVDGWTGTWKLRPGTYVTCF